jgi:dihydrofolate reductase
MNIIVAVSDNGAIGKENKLLWSISEDLRYFKKITMGSVVVMGRKTYESIGKPLPGRRNVVISRTLRHAAGVEIFSSTESALRELQCCKAEVFIIGGGELYRELLPYTTRLFITQVHINVEEADTFFPHIDMSEWKEISRESFSCGEKFEYPFEFVVFERIHK